MVLKNQEQFQNLLELSIKLSIDAGREILRIYEGEFTFNKKSDNSPITLADMNSHRIISEGLSATGIPILSEEGKDIPYRTRKAWNFFWLVDPLDGTKEFIKKNGEFTVNIALINRTRPVLGVIYAPATGLLYYTSLDRGAYKTTVECLDDIRGILSKAQRLPLPCMEDGQSLRIVASRSHMSPETEAYITRLKNKHREITYLSAGSSLKFCLIAEGKADLYPRLSPTMEWDTAAGQIIVEEAGGWVLDAMRLEPLLYNKADLRNPCFVAGRMKSVQNNFLDSLQKDEVRC
jgi:3'(2'), 5'-bisphosphate nucleotidase